MQIKEDEYNNKFEGLTWSPNSIDLNPIEHLCDVLDKHVESMESPPRNLHVQDLKDPDTKAHLQRFNGVHL